MHEKVLPKGSKKLLAALTQTASPLLKGWTLAGGTGLALHKGHRISDDFDFFRIEYLTFPLRGGQNSRSRESVPMPI